MQISISFFLEGRNVIPTAYSFIFGILKLHLSKKKSWGISINIPAPSPVFPSELTAPLCSSLHNMSKALCMISFVFFPLRLQIKPAPQLSCSYLGE